MENIIKIYNFKKIDELLLRINNAIGITGYFIYKSYGINRNSSNKKIITHISFELSCGFTGKDLLKMIDTNTNEKSIIIRKASFENSIIEYFFKIIFFNGSFLTKNNRLMRFNELNEEIVLNKKNFIINNK